MKKGGYRKGAGRKPKCAEVKLIELLSPLDQIALKSLEKGVEKGDFAFIKLFMEYRYGKPKQQIEIREQADLNIPVINWVEGDKSKLSEP